jgi:hypothetical protein
MDSLTVVSLRAKEQTDEQTNTNAISHSCEALPELDEHHLLPTIRGDASGRERERAVVLLFLVSWLGRRGSPGAVAYVRKKVVMYQSLPSEASKMYTDAKADADKNTG